MDVKNTLWNGTQNYSIRSNDGNTEIFCWQNSEKADILSYIILFIFLSAAPVAIYSLFIQVRNDPIFPVFMINLMISDLGHLCCMILTLLLKGNIIWGRLIGRIYQCVLMASAGFMVCVALERYLVIVFPVWYRFTRTVKIYLVLCVTVWFFSISAGLFTDGNLALLTLPFFLLLFFLIKTVKALSAVQSVPSDEKQRIVAILVTVVLIFFSGISLIIARMVADYRNWIHVDRIQSVFCCVTQFNPLLDLFLYFFMKEWAIDKLLAHLCCCRMDSNDISTLAA